MSDTIDVGIDLGTTNSAIAVAVNGEVAVIKDDHHQTDIIPSVVWIPQAGQTHVGMSARRRAEADVDNTASEFKQVMGYADTSFTFAKAGLSLTPEQLSAQVLQALRQNFAKVRGDAPDIAVITVPAAFALNQREATQRAAELAGMSRQCPLVQEPTAAAFAYGVRESAEPGYWLVFDFGGGTFDAAVVQRTSDELRVLNHAGDRNLGGKSIDWALVERILAPAVSRRLGLCDFTRGNRAWYANFGKLKAAAEEAKIVLSQSDSAYVDVSLEIDRNSREDFEYTLCRAELEALADPFYARAVALARSAVTEASLQPDDIDRVLLVGGATLAPGLRRYLADTQTGLGIELDFGLDPTTVVARGAALFASTVRRPRTRLRPTEPGEFALDVTHEPAVTVTTPVVAARVSSAQPTDWTKYSVVLSNPTSKPPFRSARIALNAKGAFTAVVDIDADETTRFGVELADAAGTPCRLTPSEFFLTHRSGPEFGGVPLADSLGVQRADGGFTVLVGKGTTLPTTARKTFRTSDALRRADIDAVLRIPVAEGSRSRGDRNRQVGVLEIRSKDIHIDLPAGSEVEVTFEVDTSGVVTVIADIPLVDVQAEAEINRGSLTPPKQPELRAQLSEVEQRIALLPKSDPARGRGQRLDEERALSTLREQVDAASVSDSAALAAEEAIRDLHAELDDLAEAAAIPALSAELESMLAECSTRVDQVGDGADRSTLMGLRARAADAIAAQDTARLHKQLDRAKDFYIELAQRDPDFPLLVFENLQWALRSTPQAGPLIRQGARAVARDDRQELVSVIHQLRQLLPPDIREADIGVNE
ncbi:Hsp70 family protein [Nocardia sp. NPDC052112]|uniref:Hsp70 family protein n=1 Tax=Nocardia sp. NPDC052112 TaxID=3155646 RepID=UPI0034425A0B